MSNARYVMYLTGQHNIIPEKPLVSDITHVAIAFMQSSSFNAIDDVSEWPFFTNVEKVREQFAEGTKVMVAIGGWGDTDGFEQAARTERGRKIFARNVKGMVEWTGADGVDIDWEYPGGNGEDYKKISNAKKAWQIDAYPKLLSEIRAALGTEKLMSAAVPGLPRDMLAFTKDTVPKISASLDFLNIMTYDLMNRRDNITKHHTGIQLSLDAINTYLDSGLGPEKANLGFAFYVKWFKTDPNGNCKLNPIGCNTVLMEDPSTGADLGQAGAFAWSDPVPAELAVFFEKAQRLAKYDEEGGGHYFWDKEENIWWSWDTPYGISQKFARVVREKRLGGLFAWGLGEDAGQWEHLKALTEGYKSYDWRRDGKNSDLPREGMVEDFRARTLPRVREEL